MKRLEKLQMDKAFDPVNPESRPTPAQQAIFDDLRDIELQPGEFYPAVQYRYVVAGNQCQRPDFTDILMADGSYKKLRDVNVGDYVKSYDLKTQRLVNSSVVNVWKNGPKPVYKIEIGDYSSLETTDNHQVFVKRGRSLTKMDAMKAPTLTVVHDELEGTDTYDADFTELLGYLLGDGCFAYLTPERGNRGLQFTNTNHEIIDRVKYLVTKDSDYHLRDCKQGDFFIAKQGQGKQSNKFILKIRELGLAGLVAINKFIPEYVFTQSIDTRRRFIGALISTDGWLAPDKIGFSTTSPKLATGMIRLLASVGIESTLFIRTRQNINHNPEYSVSITKRSMYNKFLTDIAVIGKSRTKTTKRENPYKTYGSRQVTSREYIGEHEVWDLEVSHSDHNYIANGILISNSGKSTLAAREIAWVVTDTHPTWTRPARWGEEPLLVLIAGQDRRMMELELWTKKIKPFLNATDWREVRVGGMLTFCEHRHLGHKIVFVSHNDSSESNRAHLQGYVSHYVWLDEMPRKINILEELQRRVDARRGYFIATFTPKSRNEAIRKVVEAASPPMGKRYRLSKLDNPLYASNREAELRKLDGYTEDQKATVLYGDWTGGDNFVYQFDTETMVVDQLPGHYSKSWRHTVAVDPALKSKFGFTLWAEDPAQGTWYLVKDDYIEGIYSPDDIVNSVQKLCAGYNIVRRISDPHESWFIGQAAKYKLNYIHPLDKSNRKPELIKNLQIALSTGKIKIAAWCKTFIEEIQNCQFQEGSEKIINSSSYHTLDASQYFVDLIPPYDESQRAKPWEQELREKNAERKLKDSKMRIATANQQRTGRILNLRGAWR